MNTSKRFFLRQQERYGSWYVVQGLTPIQLANCPLFFPTKEAAIKALRVRGLELSTLLGEELRQIEGAL